VSPQGYALLGLTALVAILVSVVVFALLRFGVAVRDSRRTMQGSREQALLAAALQDSIQKLRAQERATAVRADASERLNTQIVNSLSAGLLVVNRSGELEILNPAARRMFGIDGIPAARVSDLPRSVAPLARVIEECLTSGQPIVRREIDITGTGTVTHVGLTVSPLGAPGTGGATGAICLFSDLTAVVELEEQLRLKETFAKLGELTAGIAHEFRNGLATIHGYGRLLDPNALPPQFRPYVEGIRQETEAMRQMVTNFLGFARPVQPLLAACDLGAIIDRVAADVRPEARRLEGDIVVSGSFGTVEADDVLLRQAFMNLFRNAIEACQGSGIAPDVRVDGAIDSTQSVARVTVQDNGPGVAPEARETVFRPFFTTKKDGTGLGLALVQKIVVTHNGRISVTGSPDGGACFQVTLPIT